MSQIDYGRYSRQLLFPPLGRGGQERLLQGKVLIMGLGALGTVSAGILARAGVGFLRLVDRDFVEETNLQRQVLYTEDDARKVLPKAEAAVSRLKEVNSAIAYEALVEDVNYANIDSVVSDIDLIVDAGDNFEIRYLINEIAVKKGIPWIYGACVSSYGMTFNIMPGQGACLACALGELPAQLTETCDTAGVIGPIASLIASVQAAEAMKILSGNLTDLNEKMRYYDLWTNRFHEFDIEKRMDCPVCQKRIFPLLAGKLKNQATYLCGRNMVQVSPAQRMDISLEKLEEKLAPLGSVQNNGYLLRFLTGAYELMIFPDGRAMVKGTSDEALARSLYTRYVVG
ncbi:MAG: ThiF family adenylyltransferase [Smithellaceae bacterium]|nr:ThiF family adenylyltransferase [Smithellaceae bacterium]